MNFKKKPSNELILVFGMPRSGTTWIGKIFDSHPDTLYLHEPDTEVKLTEIPLYVISQNYEKYRNDLLQFINNLLKTRSLRVNGKMPFFKKSYCSYIVTLLMKGNVYASKVFERIGINIGLFDFLGKMGNENYSIVWKSIESCGRIGLILKSLPDVKLVYIIRHPCGQIASILAGEKNNNFSSDVSVSEDMELFETLSDLEFLREHKYSHKSIQELSKIQKIALRWAMINDQAIDAIEKHQDKAICIKYEDLCIEPIRKTKEIFSFMGMSWNMQTERFLAGDKKESNAYYSVNKDSTKSMNKWMMQLSQQEVEQIKEIVLNFKSGKLFSDSF